MRLVLGTALDGRRKPNMRGPAADEIARDCPCSGKFRTSVDDDEVLPRLRCGGTFSNHEAARRDPPPPGVHRRRGVRIASSKTPMIQATKENANPRQSPAEQIGASMNWGGGGVSANQTFGEPEIDAADTERSGEAMPL